MIAIFKREFKAYFQTPIGYIYMGLFLLLSGVFYFFDNLVSQSSYYTHFLGNILLIYLFAIPLLTMRLFSEEKRQRTDQLLLTSPVSIVGVVLGKFLAAMAVYVGTMLFTIFYAIVIAVYGDLQVMETIGSYIGFMFLGACYISLGIFISAGTENQLTAALVTFFVLMFIWMIDQVSMFVPSDTNTGIISAFVLLAAVLLFIFLNTKNWVIVLGTAIIGSLTIGGFYLFRPDLFFGFIARFLGWFSLNNRYEPFMRGVLRINALVYYTTFASLFLFLTIRIIEKRRWN